ncbi:porin [Burkholderia orbicola]|uniref:porin n=1 Tax=Burkholderia orbicola TaxID=2978683 RepID=UPI0039A76EEC
MLRKSSRCIVLYCLVFGFSKSATAQSSVTLYGLLSLGVGYVNNSGGHSAVSMIPGTAQNNRWGLRIVEDIGGGNSVVAVLENGFDLTNGTLSQGGRLFGRQAWVGIKSATYGQLTLGRQYDEVWDYLSRFQLGITNTDLAVYIGDNDNAFAVFRYSNAIKYVSPTWSGFSFAGMYAMSNAAGQFSTNSAFSLGGGYQNGPLNVGVAYVELRSPGVTPNPNGAVTNDYGGGPFLPFQNSPLSTTVGVDRQRIAGIGASYEFSKLTVNSMFTYVKYQYRDGTSLRLDDYDVNINYFISPSLIFNAGYVYTDGKLHNAPGDPRWHMASLSLDYFLSKRTDVVLAVVGLRSLGGAPAAMVLTSPSTSDRQVRVTASIRHKF